MQQADPSVDFGSTTLIKQDSDDEFNVPKKNILEQYEVKKWFKKDYWTPEKLAYIQSEISLAIIVCFLQVPESVAFAYLANVPPSSALHCAWIVGIICGVFGGRPGMINGTSGALAAVVHNFVQRVPKGSTEKTGIEYLYPSVMVCGGFMLLCYRLRFYRFISLVPATVMIGFCNGLAIVIGRSQLHPFQDEHHHWITGEELGWMILLLFSSMATMHFMPMVPVRAVKAIPASLCAILISILLEFVIIRQAAGFKGTKTIGDVSPFSEDTAFPKIFFLDDSMDMGNLVFDQDGVVRIIYQGFLLCCIAMIDSLLTMEIVAKFTGTKTDRAKSVAAAGVGNIIGGFFGGMGGESMIGLTTMFCLGGGRGRIGPITAALLVMICIMGAYPILNFIPVSALSGIMFIVCIHTFKWNSIIMVVTVFLPEKLRNKLTMHKKIQRIDAVVIVFVTGLTVIFNLAVAVIVGVSISALSFAFGIGERVKVYKTKTTGDLTVYTVDGPLFFGSKMHFEGLFDYENDAENIEIHLVNATVFDYSGLEALNNVSSKYRKVGKRVKVKSLNSKSAKLYMKSKGLHHDIDYVEGGIELPDVAPSYTQFITPYQASVENHITLNNFRSIVLPFTERGERKSERKSARKSEEAAREAEKKRIQLELKPNSDLSKESRVQVDNIEVSTKSHVVDPNNFSSHPQNENNNTHNLFSHQQQHQQQHQQHQHQQHQHQNGQNGQNQINPFSDGDASNIFGNTDQSNTSNGSGQANPFGETGQLLDLSDQKNPFQ